MSYQKAVFPLRRNVKRTTNTHVRTPIRQTLGVFLQRGKGKRVLKPRKQSKAPDPPSSPSQDEKSCLKKMCGRRWTAEVIKMIEL